MINPTLQISYTNWKGETSVRNIVPDRVWFGTTEWHPEPQWLLRAWDIDKGAVRDFALKDFGVKPAIEPVVTMAVIGDVSNEDCVKLQAAVDAERNQIIGTIPHTTSEDTRLLNGLRDLCGYIANGSDRSVNISQDDATKYWIIHVGNDRKDWTYGKSLRSAIERAMKEFGDGK